jgi:Zn-dependent protease
LDISDFLQKFSIWAIPVIAAITLHEVAHGWVARHFGDQTAATLGRLSLNPIRHIDPIGTLLVPGMLLLSGLPAFGWAKPVPVIARNLRDPRADMVYVAAAGPGANLLMAILWALLLFVVVHGPLVGTPAIWLLSMSQAGITINILLAAFNMLPVPPLDGGRVLANLLPPHLGEPLERMGRYGFFVVLLLVYGNLLNWLFEPASRLAVRLIGLAYGDA